MRKFLFVACGVSLCASVLARADEGRIPIAQPVFSNQTVMITAPGSYVLTSNLLLGDSTSNASAIVIQSSDVTLDLNGFSVEILAGTGSAIVIQDGDYKNIRIRNGKIRAGVNGISFSSSTFRTGLRLERLEISATLSDGVSISGLESFVMEECKVHDTGNNGVYLTGNGGFSGRIVGNQFTNIPNKALITGGNSLLIRDNAMQQVHAGISISLGASSILIEGNTIANDATGPAPESAIVLAAPGCHVLRNAIRGFSSGISVGFSAGGHRLAGNSITGGVGTGDGIIVTTSRNLIEGNQIEGNAGCGIRLLSSSSDNAYRDNMLRGNTGGAACVAGTGNTDAGGNVL